MSFEVEPIQPPIRRIVGRPLDPRTILTRLHHLQLFACFDFGGPASLYTVGRGRERFVTCVTCELSV
jgi:hypothetical protein